MGRGGTGQDRTGRNGIGWEGKWGGVGWVGGDGFERVSCMILSLA